MRATLEIAGLAPGGEGVGEADGRTCFVPFTAPGDRVEVELPPGDGPAHATRVRLLAPGAARAVPPCRHFGPAGAGAGAGASGGAPEEAADERGCGGCEWLHVDYAAQLAAKERGFLERVRRLAGVDPAACGARPILPSPAPLRYRSRAKFHHDRRAGRLVFFRRRSHEPVLLRECHLLEPGLDALREAVGPALAALRLEPREVSLEWAAERGRGAAWLQLPAVTPAVRERAEALLAAVPTLAGAVLGAEGVPLALVGAPVLRRLRDPADPAAGEARTRPDLFQQANRAGNARLVRAALDLLAPEGEDVLELFCGAGNFTGPLAARARSVAAVEVQGPALDLAREDEAEARGAGPGRGAGGPGAGAPVGGGAPLPARAEVRFFAGDALKLALAFAREGRRFGAVLLDPPRDGAKGIGPALRELRAPRAVYVSCDPATLARDLKACVAAGYRVAALQPVDMFPQTHHVEGVALLVRA